MKREKSRIRLKNQAGPQVYESPVAFIIKTGLDDVLCSTSPNPGENEAIQYEDWGL